jgi:hypothetical protein
MSDILSWAGQEWNNLGLVGQVAFGLGMPLGVIGLLGGGLGGVLTAVLGFGAAGFAAANSGMFGETAQNAATNATAAGSAAAAAVAGSDPAEANTPTTQTTPQNFEYNREGAQKILEEVAGAYPVPGASGLKAVVTRNQNALRAIAGQNPTEIKELFATLTPTKQQWLRTQLDRIYNNAEDNPETPQNEQTVAKDTVDKIWQIIGKNAAAGFVERTALTQLKKAARCWSGYEPVPGKKPYSNDSCRPIGSKKKKKKKAAK